MIRRDSPRCGAIERRVAADHCTTIAAAARTWRRVGLRRGGGGCRVFTRLHYGVRTNPHPPLGATVPHHGVRHHDPVFADYHRARRRRVAAMATGWAFATALTVSSILALGAFTAPPASAAPPRIPEDAAAATAMTPTPVPATAPTLAPAPEQSPTDPAVTAASRRTSYSIPITATGYQTELNACQWVRMNLADTVPLVGAHTRCGGILVLGLQLGDTVTLSGQGLDGRYRVSDARDAHAGDDSASATAGMTATVILQSCYQGGGGRVRLVGLIPF